MQLQHAFPSSSSLLPGQILRYYNIAFFTIISSLSFLGYWSTIVANACMCFPQGYQDAKLQSPEALKLTHAKPMPTVEKPHTQPKKQMQQINQPRKIWLLAVRATKSWAWLYWFSIIWPNIKTCHLAFQDHVSYRCYVTLEIFFLTMTYHEVLCGLVILAKSFWLVWKKLEHRLKSTPWCFNMLSGS